MKNALIKTCFVLLFGCLIALSIFIPARAAELTLRFSPPCSSVLSTRIGGCPDPTDPGIGAFIVRLYRFGLGIAGLLAVGAIVVGGIYYIISGGNPQKQNEAKDWIMSAIWGILLLFGSWILLNTINPQLVKLEEPEFGKLTKIDEYISQYGSGIDMLSIAIPDRVRSNTGDGSIGYPTARLPDPPLDAPVRQYCKDNAGDRADCLFSKISGNQCANCVLLSSRPNIPVKTGNMCRWIDSQPEKCYVNNNTIAKLSDLAVRTQFEPKNATPTHVEYTWQVTEAFPPAVLHKSAEHYNGCAVDVAIVTAYGGPNPAAARCTAVNALKAQAYSVGFFIIDEYASCSGTQYVTTKGDHLHLEAAGCPTP